MKYTPGTLIVLYDGAPEVGRPNVRLVVAYVSSRDALILSPNKMYKTGLVVFFDVLASAKEDR